VTSTATALTAADPGPHVDEPIRCPQCRAPGAITGRFRLGSTTGPVEHLKTSCVNHHWLTPLTEMIEGAGQVGPAEVRPTSPPGTRSDDPHSGHYGAGRTARCPRSRATAPAAMTAPRTFAARFAIQRRHR
jgi:hypothetical protein